MALVTGIAEGRIPLPSGEDTNGECSFGLEHLAGVLNSDREDVLVPGLRLAVQKFVAQDGDNNTKAGLLDAYIETSPQAVEIQTLWGIVTRRPSSPSLMALTMNILATVVPKCFSLAKWLVDTSIRDILAQIEQNVPFDCVKSALLLLLVLARVGSGPAKSLVKQLPFSHSTFTHLVAPPPEGNIHIRYLTLQLLSCFWEDTQEPSIHIACALTPGALNLAVCHPITPTRSDDGNDINSKSKTIHDEATVASLLVLRILKDQILLNLNIPGRQKNDLFINHHTQVVSVLGAAIVDADEGVRRAAIELVTLLCLDKRASTWLNAGQKGRQCILSMLVRIGKGEKVAQKVLPCCDLDLREIVRGSLETSPMIVGAYMKACASFFSLDPSASLKGLLSYRYASWILASSPFGPSTGDVTISLDIPPSVCRRDLTKAVLHKNWLLNCSGLSVVLSTLRRVDNIENRNSSSTHPPGPFASSSVREADIQNVLNNRIPDIQTTLSLSSRLSKTSAPAKSDAVLILAWNLLLEVLIMYQRVLPKAISSSKFDLAKILHSFDDILTTPPSIQQRLLFILAKAETRQVSWLQPSNSTSISPLSFSLRILTTTPHLSVRNSARCACLKALSLVAPEDADIWVDSLVRNMHSMGEDGYSGADFIASVALCVSRDPYVIAMYWVNCTETVHERFEKMGGSTTCAYQDLGISLLSVAIILILKGEFTFDFKPPSSTVCEQLKDLMKTTMSKELQLCTADVLLTCVIRSKDPLLCAALFLHELLPSPSSTGGNLNHGAICLVRALNRTSGLQWLTNSFSIDDSLQTSSTIAESEIKLPNRLALVDFLFPILSFSHFSTSFLASNIDEIFNGLNLERISPCMAPEVCALLWGSWCTRHYEHAGKGEVLMNLKFVRVRLKVTAKFILLAAREIAERNAEGEDNFSHFVWKALEIFLKSNIIASLARNWQAAVRSELVRGVAALLVMLSKVVTTIGSMRSTLFVSRMSSAAEVFLKSLCDSVISAVKESKWEIVLEQSGPLAACITWCSEVSTGKLLKEILSAFPALISHCLHQYNAASGGSIDDDTTATSSSPSNVVNHLILSLLDMADVGGTWSLTSRLMMIKSNVLLSPSTILVDAVVARAGVLVDCCCEIMSKASDDNFYDFQGRQDNVMECHGGSDAAGTLYCIAKKLTICMVSRSALARAVLEKWVTDKDELVLKSKALWPVLLCAAKGSGSRAFYRELPSLTCLLRRIVVLSCQWFCNASESHFLIEPLMAVLHLDDKNFDNMSNCGAAGEEKTALTLFRCLPLMWCGRGSPDGFLNVVCNALIEARFPTAHENLVLKVGEYLLKRAALACEDRQFTCSNSTDSFSSLTRTLFSFMSSPLGDIVLAAPSLSHHINEFMLIALQERYSHPNVLDTVRCIFKDLHSNSKLLSVLSSNEFRHWTVENMHQRLLNHSAFLKVLLCESGYVDDIAASCSLLSFLVVLASLAGCSSPPLPLSPALIKLLLSSYGMSMSHRDQLILRLLWLRQRDSVGASAIPSNIGSDLLQRAISAGIASTTTIELFPLYRPFTPPRMEFEPVVKDKDNLQYEKQLTTTAEALENDDACSDYDSESASSSEIVGLSHQGTRVMQGSYDDSPPTAIGGGPKRDDSLLNNSETLDPAFFIPVLHTALCAKTISVQNLLNKGRLLGMCVVAMSSDMLSMRVGAYACLHKAREWLFSIVNVDKNCHFNIKHAFILLERLRDGTSTSLNRLPFSSAVFFAKTLHTIVCSPGSPALTLAVSSLLQPPFTDPPRPNVPLLVFGKEANPASRSFALECLASGMRREDDIRFISQTRVIPRLLPILGVLSKQDGKTNNLEEDVMSAIESVIKIGLPGAHYLVKGGGVVDWAWARLSKGQQTTASSFNQLNIRILRVMHVALERLASSNEQKGNQIGILLYSLAHDVLGFGIRYANVKGVVEMSLRVVLTARYYEEEPLLILSEVLNKLRGEIDSHEGEWSPSLFGDDERVNKIGNQPPETFVWYPKPSHSVEGSLLLQLLCLKRAMAISSCHHESMVCTLQLLQWTSMQLNHRSDLDLSSSFLCRVNELFVKGGEGDDPFCSSLSSCLLASNDPNLGYGIRNLLNGLLSLGLQSTKNGIAALKPVIILVASLTDNELPDSLIRRYLPGPFIPVVKRCGPIFDESQEQPLLIDDEDGNYMASAACGVLLSILNTTDDGFLDFGKKKEKNNYKFVLENLFRNLNPERCVIPPFSVIDELEGLLLLGGE